MSQYVAFMPAINVAGFYGFPNTFIEKALGVSATSRNWSTLTQIVELVRRGPNRSMTRPVVGLGKGQ